MSKKIDGVHKVTEHYCSKFNNYKNAVSEDTVRRHLIAGTQVSEPRENEKAPFRVDVNSFQAFDPNVDLAGYENIADHMGKSKRQAIRNIKNGKWPVDWLFGRVYSCQCSLDPLKK